MMPSKKLTQLQIQELKNQYPITKWDIERNTNRQYSSSITQTNQICKMLDENIPKLHISQCFNVSIPTITKIIETSSIDNLREDIQECYGVYTDIWKNHGTVMNPVFTDTQLEFINILAKTLKYTVQQLALLFDADIRAMRNDILLFNPNDRDTLTKQYINELQKTYPDYSYHLVDCIKNSKDRLTVYCNVHKCTFDTTLCNHYYRNSNCRQCNVENGVKVNNLTPEELLLKYPRDDTYIYDWKNYTNNVHDKIDIYCPIHGIFKQTISKHFIRGDDCPKCSGGAISRANLEIQKTVLEYGFDCVLEFSGYSSNICHNPLTNKQLRFDVYIPRLLLFIEYNGPQHYHENNWFNIKQAKNKRISLAEQLEYVKFKDEYKKQWAKYNGCEVRVIPYFEDHVKYTKRILNEYLQQ